MTSIYRRLRLGAGMCFAAAILIFGGCANGGPGKPADIAQKIEAARTRADHQEIAVLYEQQAERDRTASERHRGLARAYERGYVAGSPWVGSRSTIEKENKSLVLHCDKLALIYQQAAVENLAMAREHRQMAAEMKD